MDQLYQMLTFEVNGRLFGLDLQNVECVVRAVEITPLPAAPKIVLGVVNMHGDLVPVLDVRRRLGGLASDVGVDDHFIIARASGRTVAMLVDKAAGVLEKPIEATPNLDPLLARTDMVDGAISIEGDMLLIHSLDRFLRLDEEGALSKALEGHLEHGD